MILVALISLFVAVIAADSVAQTAGSTVISVSTAELREVAKGWSAKKQILGKDVYNDAGDKIGEVDDLIVAPNKSLSYAIVGVGGFLGVGEHQVAVPVSRFKQQMGKIVTAQSDEGRAEGSAQVRIREVDADGAAPSGPLGAARVTWSA
jgi:sporulation protein YlmC with PRC-barrel domain